MTSTRPDLWADALTSFGFTEETIGNQTNWKLKQNEQNASISIQQKKEQLKIVDYSCQISPEALKSRLEDYLRGLWGKCTHIEMRQEQGQTFHVICESIVHPPKSKKVKIRLKPPCLMMWTFRLSVTGNAIKLYFFNHMCIGQTPSAWINATSQGTLRAIFSNHASKTRCLSVYEYEAQATLLPWSCLLTGIKSSIPVAQSYPDLLSIDVITELKVQLFFNKVTGQLRMGGLATKTIEEELATHIPTLKALESKASPSFAQYDEQLFHTINPRSPAVNMAKQLTPTRKALVLINVETPSPSLIKSYERFNEVAPSEISESFENDDDLGTVLSAILKLSVISGDRSRALQVLRLWKQKAERILGPLEVIKSFQTVIPELAGEILANIDPPRALKAFRQAFNYRENPRLLASMARVAGRISDPRAELDILDDWLQHERRSSEKITILNRKAQLHILLSEFSLALPILEELIEVSSEVKTEWVIALLKAASHGFANKALALLDAIESKIALSSASNDRSLPISNILDQVISHIWIEILKRPHVVTNRIERLAKTDLSTHAEIPFDLSRALKLSGKANQAFYSQLRNWTQWNSKQQRQEFGVGLDLFEHALLNEDQSTQYQIALSLVHLGTLPPDLIDRLISWNLTKSQAQNILQMLTLPLIVEKLKTDEISRLANFARTVDDSDVFAIKLLTSPHAIECIAQSDFEFIVEKMSEPSQRDKLTELFAARLSNGTRETRKETLPLAIYLNLIDDDGDIHHALCEDWLEYKDSSKIALRFQKLLQSTLRDALSNLLSTITERLSSDVSLDSLVSILFDELSIQDNSEAISQALHPLSQLYLSTKGHSVDALKRVIGLSHKVHDSEFASQYLAQLMDLNEPSPFDLELTENLLSQRPSALLKFYSQQVLIPSTDAEARVHIAKKAIKAGHEHSLKIDDLRAMYSLLIQEGQIELIDLKKLRSLAESPCDFSLVLEGCQHLLSLDLSSHDRLEVLHVAIPCAEHETGDLHTAIKLQASLAEISQNPQDSIKLAHLHFQLGDDALGAVTLRYLLQDRLHILKPIEIEVALTGLLRGTPTAEVETLIDRLVLQDGAETSQDAQKLLRQLAFKKGVASYKTLVGEIATLASAQKIEEMVEVLFAIIKKIEPFGASAHTLLKDLQAEFIAADQSDPWRRCIAMALTDTRFHSIAKTFQLELEVQHSLYTFYSDGSPSGSISSLGSLHARDPKEHRLWIPLFLVLRDANRVEELASLLESIIPELEKNEEPLRSYPVSLDSLRNTLVTIRSNNTALESPIISLSEKLSDKLPDKQLKASSRSKRPSQAFDGGSALNLVPSPDDASLRHEESISVIEAPAMKPQANKSTPQNWRSYALSLEVPTGSTQHFLRTAFASETEKHIALQVSSLLHGDLTPLNEWHWRPWQEAQEFSYPMIASVRMPEQSDLRMLNTPIANLILEMSPVFDRIMRSSFSSTKTLGSRASLNNLIPFDDEVILRTGLVHFTNALVEESFSFLNTPRIGSTIMLDPKDRAFVISKDDAMRKPPGHLFHNTRRLVYILRSGFFSFAQSDIDIHIIPALQHLHLLIRNNPLERIKSGFSSQASSLQSAFEKADLTRLGRHLRDSKDTTTKSSLQQLQFEINRQSLRFLLAGTLDLVGIVESILGVYVKDLSPSELKDKIKTSRTILDLFQFSTKLRF